MYGSSLFHAILCSALALSSFFSVIALAAGSGSKGLNGMKASQSSGVSPSHPKNNSLHQQEANLDNSQIDALAQSINDMDVGPVGTKTKGKGFYSSSKTRSGREGSKGPRHTARTSGLKKGPVNVPSFSLEGILQSSADFLPRALKKIIKAVDGDPDIFEMPLIVVEASQVAEGTLLTPRRILTIQGSHEGLCDACSQFLRGKRILRPEYRDFSTLPSSFEAKAIGLLNGTRGIHWIPLIIAETMRPLEREILVPKAVMTVSGGRKWLSDFWSELLRGAAVVVPNF